MARRVENYTYHNANAILVSSTSLFRLDAYSPALCRSRIKRRSRQRWGVYRPKCPCSSTPPRWTSTTRFCSACIRRWYVPSCTTYMPQCMRIDDGMNDRRVIPYFASFPQHPSSFALPTFRPPRSVVFARRASACACGSEPSSRTSGVRAHTRCCCPARE